MTDHPTSSEVFSTAVERMASAFREFRKRGIAESSIQAIEAVRKKQEEHEVGKRRISRAIAAGARISRNQ
jgi:hypothetical protein